MFLQILQKKHENLERDLVVLGEHVCSLDAKAVELSNHHSQHAQLIQIKQKEINQAWNALVSKVVLFFYSTLLIFYFFYYIFCLCDLVVGTIQRFSLHRKLHYQSV